MVLECCWGTLLQRFKPDFVLITHPHRRRRVFSNREFDLGRHYSYANVALHCEFKAALAVSRHCNLAAFVSGPLRGSLKMSYTVGIPSLISGLRREAGKGGGMKE